jgi:hypothetical protein
MAALGATAVAIAMLLLATITNVALATTATTAKGPVIYIFGDSMSDVGNNNYLLLSIAKCDYPWYGIDYEGGYPTGRFTNGRTIGDIMGKSRTDMISIAANSLLRQSRVARCDMCFAAIYACLQLLNSACHRHRRSSPCI